MTSSTRFSIKSTSEARKYMPSRPERSCKGDFGRVLCVCGSHSMAGAAFLCAKAAYRAGAGLVEIFTPECNRTILQTLIPEAIITCFDNGYSSDALISAIERADCIVAGCGLGTSAEARRIVTDLLHNVDTEKTPLILDADALNIISRHKALNKYAKGAIITPHAKEMSRLCGKSVEQILEATVDTALDFAKENGLICALKDHETIVADGAGAVYLNTTGNSGMATGGSGDVLAGILAGLAAQKKRGSTSLTEIAALGVYLHGLCGDLAAERLTEYCVMASDIIDELPRAMNSILK